MFNYLMDCKSLGTVAQGKVSYVPRIGELICINDCVFEVISIMYNFSPDKINSNLLVIKVKAR